MDNLTVILCRTRFPENVGMAARACANMGCHDLRLATPRNWSMLKAYPLASSCGQPVLDNIRIFSTLSEAVGDCNAIYGSTARLGGWRKSVIPVDKAGEQIANQLINGEKIALLLGSETEGLTNEELKICGHIINIPTAPGASSLNLAQAALLMLHECARNLQKVKNKGNSHKDHSCSITAEDQTRLETSLKKSLAMLDCMHGKNPDYFFIQWHNILSRAQLQRHEYDALMGFCRQLNNRLK